MASLIFILVTLALLVGFFVLTRYEARRGVRFYASHRTRLDTVVTNVWLVLTHTDLPTFLRSELRGLIGRLGHDIAHLSLLIVRAVERLLTRLVRRLRTHPEIDLTPRSPTREFVKTLSDFKDNLKATHPDISSVQSDKVG